MKLKSILISGSAALTLLLASCGDGSSSTENDTTESSETPSSASTDAYPLDACVVSGEKLGSMGTPVVIKHEGIEVRFCCKSCLPDFKADPKKFLAMVKAGKVEPSAPSDHSSH